MHVVVVQIWEGVRRNWMRRLFMVYNNAITKIQITLIYKYIRLRSNAMGFDPTKRIFTKNLILQNWAPVAFTRELFHRECPSYYGEFENHTFTINATSTRGQWVNIQSPTRFPKKCTHQEPGISGILSPQKITNTNPSEKFQGRYLEIQTS